MFGVLETGCHCTDSHGLTRDMPSTMGMSGGNQLPIRGCGTSTSMTNRLTWRAVNSRLINRLKDQLLSDEKNLAKIDVPAPRNQSALASYVLYVYSCTVWYRRFIASAVSCIPDILFIHISLYYTTQFTSILLNSYPGTLQNLVVCILAHSLQVSNG